MIYLDNAATTFPKPEEVYSALDRANREYGFNAGRGGYKKSKNISKIIDETRDEIASLVDCSGNNTIFASSSTEALNLIIFGLEWNKGDNVYVSPFEHNSVMRPLNEIKKRYDINIIQIPFDKETWEVEDKFEDMLILSKPKCIFCSSKSNITGYNLPIEKIFKAGKKHSSINILDASQSFGVDKKIKKIDTDFIIFAGHKSLYASFGVAGFININNIFLKPYLYGGTGSDSLNLDMPTSGTSHLEAGSKNIIAIYGLHESIKWVKEHEIENKEKELFMYLYNSLKKLDKIKMYLPTDINKCCGIMSFNIDGYTAEEIGDILDQEFDICVRTGYHCCPYIHDFIDSKKFNGTVRVSMNYFNTLNDIDCLVRALETL